MERKVFNMLSVFGKRKSLKVNNDIVQVPNLESYNEYLSEMLLNVKNMKLSELSLKELYSRKEHYYDVLNEPIGNLGEIHRIGKIILDVFDEAINKKIIDILVDSIESGIITLEESDYCRSERKLILLEELNKRKEGI